MTPLHSTLCSQKANVLIVVLAMTAVLLSVFGSVFEFTRGTGILSRRTITLNECRAAADAELERMYYVWRSMMLKRDSISAIEAAFSQPPTEKTVGFNDQIATSIQLPAEGYSFQTFNEEGGAFFNGQSGTMRKFLARVTAETQINGEPVRVSVGREFIYFWSPLSSKAMYARNDLELVHGSDLVVVDGDIAAGNDIFAGGTAGATQINSSTVNYGGKLNGDETGMQDLQGRHEDSSRTSPVKPPSFPDRANQVERLSHEINTLDGLDPEALATKDKKQNQGNKRLFDEVEVPKLDSQGQQMLDENGDPIIERVPDTNDVYAAILEPPPTDSDSEIPELAPLRLHNQAGTRITISGSSDQPNVSIQTVDSQGKVRDTYNSGDPTVQEIIPTEDIRKPVIDHREQREIPMTTIDMAALKETIENPTGSIGDHYNGIIYFHDELDDDTGVRLINAHELPEKKGVSSFTFATNKGLYLKGDFNTGDTGDDVPSNANKDATKTSSVPTVAKDYDKIPASLMADAVTIHSSAWDDDVSNNSSSRDQRAATSTTINAVIATGNVPTNESADSGGMHNLIRFDEYWWGHTFTFNGSLMLLFNSRYLTGPWIGTNYAQPSTRVTLYDEDVSKVRLPGLIATSYARGAYYDYGNAKP